MCRLNAFIAVLDDFKNVSSNFMKYMVKKYISLWQCLEFGNDCNFDDDDDADTTISTKSEITSLYVYVTTVNDQPMKTFCISSPRSCSMLCDVDSQPADIDCLRSVAVNDRLYNLNLQAQENTKIRQRFRWCPLANMRDLYDLRPPPLFVTEFQMCYVPEDNKIYLYDHYFHEAGSLPDRQNTRIDLMCYNFELNNWSVTTNMKKHVTEACMTVCNNVVYIIGGYHYADKVGYGKLVQAYDYRAPEWNLLPKPSGVYSAAACCVLDEKIYVCGGESRPRQAERFDPKAGRWETIESMNLEYEFHQVVPYANRLWAIGGNPNYEFNYNSNVDVYNPLLNKWEISTVMKDASRKHDYLSVIKDAVVFK
jgi:hypothetical protein